VRYAYLVVEGPHEVEFVGRLLKPYQFKRVKQYESLDPYWDPLIPKTFPHRGDLSLRVPIPTFFAAGDVSVAVHAAGGDSKLHLRVEETLATVHSNRLEAVGVFIDSDFQNLPVERFNKVRAKLAQVGLTLPAQPGMVSATVPRCGVFVLPDNHAAGTLEDLLIECAASSYPGLLTEAQALVGRVQPNDPAFTSNDMEDFLKPSGPKKATVACIAGILKPGKAIQNSIQDNRWLDAQAMRLPRIDAVQRFLKELLALN
jgi:hypothetical protein